MSEDKDWDFSWDWVQPQIEKYIVPEIIRLGRERVCKECDRLNKIKVCKACGCFIPAKTLLKHDECPLGKWSAME